MSILNSKDALNLVSDNCILSIIFLVEFLIEKKIVLNIKLSFNFLDVLLCCYQICFVGVGIEERFPGRDEALLDPEEDGQGLTVVPQHCQVSQSVSVEVWKIKIKTRVW